MQYLAPDPIYIGEFSNADGGTDTGRWVQERESAARRELYDRFAGRLMAVCMRYAGDRATAEDLLHDAFLKIYGAFDKFSYRGSGSLRAWMERITVNVALEWLRTRNRRGFTEL